MAALTFIRAANLINESIGTIDIQRIGSPITKRIHSAKVIEEFDLHVVRNKFFKFNYQRLRVNLTYLCALNDLFYYIVSIKFSKGKVQHLLTA